jgi:Family of unknown function (DUF5675)
MAGKEVYMHLLVTRSAFGDKATEGTLFVDGARECCTLEPTFRAGEDENIVAVKVKGKTAIPDGTYGLTISFSPKFGREMPLLTGVPDFEDVRIHTGNSDVDTEGCILLGEQVVDGDFIAGSRVAFNAFFPKLQAAIAAGERVTITVRKAN